VAALRLDDGVAVDAGDEPGPERDDARRVREGGAGVALGHDRVDDDFGLVDVDDARVRIDDHRQSVLRPGEERLVGGADAFGGDALDEGAAFVDRVRKRHGAANDQRLRQVGADDAEADVPEAPCHAAAQVAAAFDDGDGAFTRWEEHGRDDNRRRAARPE